MIKLYLLCFSLVITSCSSLNTKINEARTPAGKSTLGDGNVKNGDDLIVTANGLTLKDLFDKKKCNFIDKDKFYSDLNFYNEVILPILKIRPNLGVLLNRAIKNIDICLTSEPLGHPAISIGKYIIFNEVNFNSRSFSKIEKKYLTLHELLHRYINGENVVTEITSDIKKLLSGEISNDTFANRLNEFKFNEDRFGTCLLYTSR